jgi:hypothetical protein
MLSSRHTLTQDHLTAPPPTAMLRWPVNARSSVPRSPGADADLRTFLRRSTGNATPFTPIARANATRLAAGSPTPSPAVARPDRESSPGEAHPLKLRLDTSSSAVAAAAVSAAGAPAPFEHEAVAAEEREASPAVEEETEAEAPAAGLPLAPGQDGPEPTPRVEVPVLARPSAPLTPDVPAEVEEEEAAEDEEETAAAAEAEGACGAPGPAPSLDNLSCSHDATCASSPSRSQLGGAPEPRPAAPATAARRAGVPVLSLASLAVPARVSEEGVMSHAGTSDEGSDGDGSESGSDSDPGGAEGYAWKGACDEAPAKRARAPCVPPLRISAPGPLPQRAALAARGARGAQKPPLHLSARGRNPLASSASAAAPKAAAAAGPPRDESALGAAAQQGALLLRTPRCDSEADALIGVHRCVSD